MSEILRNHRWQSQQSRLELGLSYARRIVTGERFGLLTRIATMESGSLCTRMKN